MKYTGELIQAAICDVLRDTLVAGGAKQIAKDVIAHLEDLPKMPRFYHRSSMCNDPDALILDDGAHTIRLNRKHALRLSAELDNFLSSAKEPS